MSIAAPTAVPTDAINSNGNGSMGRSGISPQNVRRFKQLTARDSEALSTTACVGTRNRENTGIAASANPKPVNERSTEANTTTAQTSNS